MRKRFTAVILVSGVVLTLAVSGYLWVTGARRYPVEPVWSVPGGDAEAGRQAILKHGCNGCHVIPGMAAPMGRVGPSLVDFQYNVYIAGVVANTPENAIAWIMHPQTLSPGNAMPTQGVTSQEARDIAAFLYGQ